MRRIETVDLVGALIDRLDYRFFISSITDLGSFSYKIFTCNTLFVYKGQKLTIDGNDYTVTEVIANTSIKVKGTIALDLNLKSFVIPKPFYKYGTIIATDSEIKRPGDAQKVLPLIYFRIGPGISDRFLLRDSVNDRISNVELYFLANTQHSLPESELRNIGIVAMRNLVYLFEDGLKKNKDLIGIVEEFRIEDQQRAGFQATDGAKGKYFNFCDMSGCKVELSIPFTKKFACCTN